MKRLIISVSLIISFVFCYCQPQVPRSGGSVTATDSNLFSGNSFRVPIFTDTTAANNNRPSLDSSGKLIFTRDINWFWGRQTSPDRKWVPFNNSSNGLTATCGSANGTHIVTWDSLLTFDVSGGPYVICCDGIPRATNNTSITLDTNSTDFPRIDLIILDTAGVNWIKGTPAENPATPSTDSCQIILSYVLINAHDSMPANISPPTNPLIIYDENDRLTEWIIDTVSNVTADTANTIFPAHLVHSMSVSSFTSGNLIRFHTDTPIDLNSYGALKFYIRKTTVASSTITLRFLLNGAQITFPLNSTTPNGGTSGYIAYVIPISNFILSGGSTTVNELQIVVSTLGAGAFYMDWIQLQSGTFINNINQGGGITSVGMNTLDSLLIPSVTNPTVSPVFSFTKYDIPAYRVLVNDSTGNAKYKWGQVDLGTSMVTGLLPVTNLVPGNTGDYLGTDGGIVQWIPLGEDTTFVHNWIRRTVDPNSNNDTLSFGSRDRDSSVLAFNTYVGLNNNQFTIEATPGDDINFFRLDATGTPFSYFSSSLDKTMVIDNFGTEALNVFGASNGMSVVAQNGYGLTVSSQGNQFAISSTAIGAINANSFNIISSSTNSVENLFLLGREVESGNGANGVGLSFIFTAETSTTVGRETNEIISKWIDATDGTRTSQFKITGVFSASTVDVFTGNSDGSWQIRPITATAASAITPAEGMMLFVSSTDATFTSIGFWSYENGAWHKM